MILGPIGKKWVCAAGVERSTLHRCGLTGLGLINPFFHSKMGPWSVTFPGRDREVEVIKNRSFSSHLRSRGRVACQAGLYQIYIFFYLYINKKIRCLLTGCSSLSTLQRRPVRERLLDLCMKDNENGFFKKEKALLSFASLCHCQSTK